jgi:iron complex outermembrane recepter protein
VAPSKPSILAAALVAAGLNAQAQQLAPVTIVAKPAADITPFGGTPLSEVPASVSIISRQQIEESGARRLADLTKFDASINDAYNAPGYWDFLSIRGFTLDNRFNYRREGLPVSAETAVPLDNKERIEVLKGTSGIQAGTSAPGGLVNYIVKRPTANDLRQVRFEATQKASMLAAVDIGGRAGSDKSFGYRLNVAQERLRPEIRGLDGERSLFAAAADWRASRESLFEAEIEWSRQRQPSQIGFSLLGAVLPQPADPRANLNNQPWVDKTRFDAWTGSLRFTQAMGNDWHWSARLGTQRLKTDDYTAFPFGCSSEGNFDRFCSDGTFDYYDFRSEDEHRRQDAAAVELRGKVLTGSVEHDVTAGVMAGRVRNRYELQAFNWVGIGHVGGTVVVPEDPTRTFAVEDRDERSVELSLNAATRWSARLSSWIGLRHTRLDRGYAQNMTTPWLAVAYKVGETVAYASWGQGVESHQVSTNPVYALANAGQVLPAAKSRQVEAGLKGGTTHLAWQVAAFRITRPVTNFDFCARTFSCTVGEYDGQAVHQGIETSGQWTQGPWRVSAGLMLLDARRKSSTYEPVINGNRPANVPDHVVRVTGVYRVPGTALEIEGHASREGSRAVLADETVMLPAWTRLDAALRYRHRIGAADASWTLGIQNLLDRRYWRESPYQFNHVYLYPGAPRTIRVAFTATL